MLNDKVYHQGSYVPLSVEKMFEFNRLMNSALKRMKWMDPGGKNIIINANETVQDMSGKSLEQWLLRVCVMYLLFGEKAMGMI